MSESWHGGGGRWGLLVHGGAGSREGAEASDEASGCLVAARAGAAVLSAGGSALDAVQRAVECLEDDPRFNAGTGGALTRAGTLELDAAIMSGDGLRLGAVCVLPPFRHPVAVARAVLERGRHVLYAADGAAAFARANGFALARESDMITAASRTKLERFLATDDAATGGTRSGPSGSNTVGAVARDTAGHVAAATSTGGITGKEPGRVGDSPLAGAGTYADDALGAASATGVGEGIIRMALSTRTLLRLAAGGTPDAACAELLAHMLATTGARGGLILAAPDGRLGFARTTPSMPWAAVWDDGHAFGS